MKKLLLLSVLFLFACAPKENATEEKKAEKPLQEVLEEVRIAYKRAGESGDIERFKSLMSSYHWSKTHNNAASWGFTVGADSIKRLVRSAPESGEVEFFELLQKGDTAGLVQKWKKVSTNGRGDQFVSYCFTKFVKEGGQWKVDTGGYRLGEKLYIVDDKFSTSAFKNEDFHIDGLVRKALALRDPVEIVGKLVATSYDFDLKVWVNGEEVKVSQNTSTFMVLPNGLKKGKNTIKVNLTATGSRKAESVELSIKAKNNDVLIDLGGKLKEGDNIFVFNVM